MKVLATKPTNAAELLRRKIAVVLDQAFTNGPTKKDHRLLLPDFDALVEQLALSVERAPQDFSLTGTTPNGRDFTIYEHVLVWHPFKDVGSISIPLKPNISHTDLLKVLVEKGYVPRDEAGGTFSESVFLT